MKDPRHKLDAKGHCKRCGLGSRHGKCCPVGFWADRKQHAAVDARIDEGKGFGDLERQWLAEWRAAQQTSDGQEKSK